MSSYEIKHASTIKEKKETKHIPLDIVEQILLRLPVKAILRFRLVSKLWYATSSDASFVQKHLNIANKNPSPDLIICSCWRRKQEIHIEKGSLKRELWLPKEVQNHAYGLVGSCNGLVCMHISNVKISVFNVSTRETISLPDPCNIGFGSSRWNFGFNPNTNEHKIIHFYEVNPSYEGRRVEVFTLGKDTSSWRRIQGAPPVNFPSRVVNLNIGSTMYWKVYNPVTSILSFDLSEEKFARIDAPKKEGFSRTQIMDLNGRLCWISVTGPCSETINLWTLDEKSEKINQWTLLRTIKHLDLIHSDWWRWPSLWYFIRNKIIIEQAKDKRNIKHYQLDFTIENDSVGYVLSKSNHCGWPPFGYTTAVCAHVESLLPLPISL